MVISRRVNACASPDWPKPLYQWGATAWLPIDSELWLQQGAGKNISFHSIWRSVESSDFPQDNYSNHLPKELDMFSVNIYKLQHNVPVYTLTVRVL